ncbi:MAG: hypothetical protein JO112_02655 [Planctomycetes bacterium]|nr:hypothetical protein [Planctomycetota bacterium]
MGKPASPEQRAEALVGAGSKIPGGPWFVELKELVQPSIFLGPYENPSLAQEDARKLQHYLAEVIREALQANPS